MPAKFLIPVVGAFIGWITNVIAIWLLFHPYKKTLGIQGLLPKNKDAMADKLGKLVKEHLLDNETLIRAINLEEKIKEILNKLIKDLNPLTRAVLKNLVDPIAAFLKGYIEKELKNLAGYNTG